MAVCLAYKFLTNEMNLNKAAASGVIANFIAESGIRTTAMGDNGTSYGLCQWHNERWDKLCRYAKACEKPMEDIDTQLHFFMDEVVNEYPELYQELLKIEDTELGAYRAGYIITMEYEKPLAGEVAADSRGAAGASTYGLTIKEYCHSDAVLKILYMLSIYQNSYISPKLLVNGNLVLPHATDIYIPEYSNFFMTYDANYWNVVESTEEEVWPEWIQIQDLDSFDLSTESQFSIQDPEGQSQVPEQVEDIPEPFME